MNNFITIYLPGNCKQPSFDATWGFCKVPWWWTWKACPQFWKLGCKTNKGQSTFSVLAHNATVGATYTWSHSTSLHHHGFLHWNIHIMLVGFQFTSITRPYYFHMLSVGTLSSVNNTVQVLRFFKRSSSQIKQFIEDNCVSVVDDGSTWGTKRQKECNHLFIKMWKICKGYGRKGKPLLR